MKNWCGISMSLTVPASSSSSSPSSVSGWGTDNTPVTTEHWSGTLLCLIRGDGILIWCAAYDGSNCLIKSGIFIWVHRHWVVGILMWRWLDVHSNRPGQKEWLHGEQDKGRYEKRAGLWMTEEALFFCTNITERTGLLRTSSGSCFLLYVTGWATPRERTITSPAFIPSTFPPKRDFCPVQEQAHSRLQYIHLMSSTVCSRRWVTARIYCDATNTLLIKTTGFWKSI